MSVYQPANNRKVAVSEGDRYNNQAVLYGTNPALPVTKGIFWLESVIAASGTLSIVDGKGNVIVTAVTSWESNQSPLRCDYGITITGSVAIAKGFVQMNVFEE
jgi:hypothetical protein